MEVLAKGKTIRISPKKAREVADLVRGKNATEARAILKFVPKKAAKIIDKVLASAMANAENNFNLDKDALVISKLMVDGGPVLKRWQPRAKGAAFEIRKRSSHITVVVSGDVKTKKVQAPKTAEKPKEMGETEEHKIEVERPGFAKKEGFKGANVKSKMFRRKTG